MITTNLYERILMNPVINGADKLYVVSGYASPAIVYKHLNDSEKFSIDLIIGMAIRDGMRLWSHNAFVKLAKEDFPTRFKCSYLTTDRPAHSKLYGWYKGTMPINGFAGSANYSQPAFSNNQMEAMVECEAVPIRRLFNELVKVSVNCLDSSVGDRIYFYDERNIVTRKVKANGQKEYVKEYVGEDSQFGQSLTLSLLTEQGIVGNRSGVNWGQRPGRDPNEAYIPVPIKIRRLGFFPPRGQHFILATDDNKILDCVIAQDDGKAIETYKNNSILGRYLRERMGVASGERITSGDFARYGRNNVDIHKIDEETYYLDFSK